MILSSMYHYTDNNMVALAESPYGTIEDCNVNILELRKLAAKLNGHHSNGNNMALFTMLFIIVS